LLPLPASDFKHRKLGSFKATELVFIGELSAAGGLKDFCDTMDSLLASGSISSLKFTFFGSLNTVNGLGSKEYIQLRSSKWESSKVEWEVIGDSSMKTAFEYVNAENSGRLAVMPAYSDFSSVMKNNFDFYGLPNVKSDMYNEIKDSIFAGGIFNNLIISSSSEKSELID
jgi:hypothetical protein